MRLTGRTTLPLFTRLAVEARVLAPLVPSASASAAIFLAFVCLQFVLGVPHVNTADQTTQALLSSIAQSLASVTGLVLSLALVVAQLSQSYSRASVAEFFGPAVIGAVLFYVVNILVALFLMAQDSPSRWSLALSLDLTAASLLLIMPFFVFLKIRSTPSSMLDRQRFHLEALLRSDRAPDRALEMVESIDAYGRTAVVQHDYETFQLVCATLAGTAASAGRKAQLPIVAACMGRLANVAVAEAANERVGLTVLEHFVEVRTALRTSVAELTPAQRGAAVRTLAEGLASMTGAVVPTTNVRLATHCLTELHGVVADAGDHMYSEIAGLVTRALSSARFRASRQQGSRVAGHAAALLARIGVDTRSEPVPPGQAMSPTNLLSNASAEFGERSARHRRAGWFESNRALATWLDAVPARTLDRRGQWLLEAMVDEANASFAQDVPFRQGHDSYSLSGWFNVERAGGYDDGRPVVADLALWAQGGVEERGQTRGELVDGWRFLHVPLDLAYEGHDGLRAEVYIQTTEVKILVDDLQLVSTNLHNASFEMHGLAEWSVRVAAPAVETPGSGDGPAADAVAARPGAAAVALWSGELPPELGGQWYCQLTATVTTRLEQSVQLPSGAAQTLVLSCWIRASEGVPQVTGRLFVSDPQTLVAPLAATPFIVGPQWTQIGVPYETDGKPTVATVGVELDAGTAADVDGFLLLETRLRNASFEAGSDGWQSTPDCRFSRVSETASVCGGGWAAQLGGAQPGDGQPAGGQRRAGPPGPVEIWQDIEGRPAIGDSIQFGVWMRAAPPDESVLVAVSVQARDRNGAVRRELVTRRRVGPEWEHVSAPFDTISPAEHALRVCIELPEDGARVLIDGAGLGHAGSRVAVASAGQRPFGPQR